MNPNSFSPPTGSPTSTRMRLKWENIMIVLIGVVVATFAVVGILASGGTDEPTKQAAKPAPTLDASAEPEALSGDALTIDDATSLVEEAGALMLEARWDEAIDRLDTIPADLRDVSGAAEVEVELSANRAKYEQLRGELDAAVEATQFPEARVLLAQLVGIAKHDSSLIELGVEIDDAEASAANPTAQVKKAKKDSKEGDVMKPGAAASKPSKAAATPAATGGGGAATTGAKPSSSKPAGSGAKPAKPSGSAGGSTGGGSGTRPPTGGGTGSGSVSGASPSDVTAAAAAAGISPGALGGSLSAADQAALQAALNELLAGGQLF
ncbi:MAG: hypothetical protein ABI200_03655 [Gaiellales bacterium]